MNDGAFKGSRLPNLEEQELLRTLLRSVNHLTYWRLGDQINYASGRRIAIGVFPWSKEDNEFLNKFIQTQEPDRFRRCPIYIFCPQYDVDKYIPGLSGISSPFLGIWEDGKIKECIGGHRARKRINEIFDEKLYSVGCGQ